MDDEVIKKHVVDEIFWDSQVDASDVKAEVSGGQVKLEGTVPTYGAKLAADIAAWNVTGVTSVENDLRVKHGQEPPTDKEISKMVENKMVWNPNLLAHKIGVDVESGVVTLTGTVDKYWKKVAAYDEAATVLGVVDIVNNIAIAPSGNYVDQDIAREISDTLARRYMVDNEGINVVVKDGRVSLTGAVPGRLSSYAAEKVAENTAGVIEVDNRLKVRN